MFHAGRQLLHFTFFSFLGDAHMPPHDGDSSFKPQALSLEPNSSCWKMNSRPTPTPGLRAIQEKCLAVYPWVVRKIWLVILLATHTTSRVIHKEDVRAYHTLSEQISSSRGVPRRIGRRQERKLLLGYMYVVWLEDPFHCDPPQANTTFVTKAAGKRPREVTGQ